MWFKHKIIKFFVAVESATSNAIRCYEENLEAKSQKLCRPKKIGEVNLQASAIE